MSRLGKHSMIWKTVNQLSLSVKVMRLQQRSWRASPVTVLLTHPPAWLAARNRPQSLSLDLMLTALPEAQSSSRAMWKTSGDTKCHGTNNRKRTPHCRSHDPQKTVNSITQKSKTTSANTGLHVTNKFCLWAADTERTPGTDTSKGRNRIMDEMEKRLQTQGLNFSVLGDSSTSDEQALLPFPADAFLTPFPFYHTSDTPRVLWNKRSTLGNKILWALDTSTIGKDTRKLLVHK